MANFEQFNLQPYLLNAINALGFKEPTPIQERVIPMVMSGKSVVGQSRTGSGKSHAFLLPIFNKLNLDANYVQVVITAPSRELAYQLTQTAEQLAKYAPQQVHIGSYIGGTDKQRQVEKLALHQPQIVIGTPGRILDLLRSQVLDIHKASTFVVDEADMTLDMGFLPDVDRIAGILPANLQMLVFSATIPQKLRPFLKKYMRNPIVEEIKSQTIISPNVENWLFSTKGRDKNKLIYQLLKIDNPFLAIVFANTKQRVDEIHSYLTDQGMKVAKIHGGLQPRERKRIIKEVMALKYRYVVATDLAARGIDIEGVSHVINDDVPEDLEFFIHRVGRTGRQNMHGIAETFYEPGEEERIDELEKMGIKFEPKAIFNGGIVDTHDRNRRDKRKPIQMALDPTLKGLVKKVKKNKKPGYKRKIKTAIERDVAEKRKLARRAAIRRNRKRSK